MSGDVSAAAPSRIRLRAVVAKEFREYRRNRMIVLTMALSPLLFLVLPLLGSLTLPESAGHTVVSGVVGQAMLMLLIVPLLLPTTVAAYTVIGEREQGTLEPVLTTPVTDRELLLGKALAATVPALALSWSLFGAYVLIVRLGAAAPVVEAVWRPAWFAAQLLLAPVLAGFAIVVGMAISARSSDIRVAQQLAGLAALPVMGGLAAVAYGAITPSVGVFAAAGALFALVDGIGWRGLTRMFDRERLLTR